MKFKSSIVILGLASLWSLPCAAWSAEEKVVNVYSARIEKLIKPAFDAFTKETGIQVKYLNAKDTELLERLKAEEKLTPTDLLITVDAGNLWMAAQEGLLQPVTSEVLEKNVPAHLQDPENLWFGLTVRARTIVYSKERVKPSELSTYEALGDPRWKGKLCLRTSKKVYTLSLVSAMISALGQEKAQSVVQGWMNNQPIIFDSDVKILDAIKAGQCDVGLVNTYYLGSILKNDSQYPVGLFWANQQESGTHVNISGAGVTRYAKNKENAIKLLEFLSSEKAQNLFADENLEYPVNPQVKPNAELAQWWGESFKQDSLNVSEAGKNQAQAAKLLDALGYK